MKNILYILLFTVLQSNAQVVFPLTVDSKLVTESVTATTTVTAWNKYLSVSPSANTTITLPTAVGNEGKQIVLKRTDNTANTVTIDAAGSETIDGLPTVTLTVSSSITIYSNGTNCYIATSMTPPSVPLEYGRVYAPSALASVTFSNTVPGSKIPFSGTLYNSSMAFSGTDGLVPTTTGRYRASWLMMNGSEEFLDDGRFYVVQNGLSVGQVFYNMMEAAGVNQCAGFIDVDLVAGVPVFLHYWSQNAAGDGLTWDAGSYFQLTQLPTAVAPVVNNVAEYGENNGIVNNTTFSTTLTDIAGSTFTLPSAGDWEVEYVVFGDNSAVNGVSMQLYNSANIAVPYSLSQIGAINAGEERILTNKTYITTAGAETFKLRGQTFSGTYTIYNNGSIGTSNAGHSKITYEKVAGALPSTGNTVDVVSVNLTGSNFSIPVVNTDVIFNTLAFGNIPYNNTTGVFTLTSGKTYELESTLKSRGTTAGYIQYEWVDAVTNVPITGGINGLDMHATSTLVEGSSSRAYLMYTPVTNQTVKVRVTGISGTSLFLDEQRCNANIKQINSTNTIGGNTNVLDQSSAGYFDIGNMRMQWGTFIQGSGTNSVVLPAAFANTNYVVTANNQSSVASDRVIGTTFSNKTTTGFETITNSISTVPAINQSAGNTIGWIAIGQKP